MPVLVPSVLPVGGAFQDQGAKGVGNTDENRGQRRRDAEEKLEHHLERARHEADLHAEDAANQEDIGGGR